MLARIEGKIDRIAAQPYETAMRSGRRLLEDAQRSWRSQADALLLLEQARLEFVAAAAAAPDDASAAEADVRVAMTWLLLGSGQDCRVALDEAAARLVTRSTERPPQPTFSDVRAEAMRTASWDTRIEIKLRRDAHLLVQRAKDWVLYDWELDLADAVETLAAVQQIRRRFGVTPEDAPLPSLSVDISPFARSPSIRASNRESRERGQWSGRHTSQDLAPATVTWDPQDPPGARARQAGFMTVLDMGPRHSG
jgi:hypothetical protein